MRHIRLGVNVDHVANIRQQRGTKYPDPVFAAFLAEIAGADQITVHLREDRRHIQERDLRILRETVSTMLNLEMAENEDVIKIALEVVPDIVTLVPERRMERTTEGGLLVTGREDKLKTLVERFHERGIKVSLFINPDLESINSSAKIGVDQIEIHTGFYAEVKGKDRDKELERITLAAREGANKGLAVAAGHGLDYTNVIPICHIPEIEELNIGHSIVARAVFVGFEQAVREMVATIRTALY